MLIFPQANPWASIFKVTPIPVEYLWEKFTWLKMQVLNTKMHYHKIKIYFQGELTFKISPSEISYNRLRGPFSRSVRWKSTLQSMITKACLQQGLFKQASAKGTSHQNWEYWGQLKMT